MNAVVCPLCASQLAERQVAPCHDCGGAPSEIGECERGEHEYHVFELWGHEVVLCDFCDADFGSYYPEFWGLPAGADPDYPLTLLRKVDAPTISIDLYCSSCKHRLVFLQLLKAVRDQHRS
jgi:hypothetical protein